MRRPILGTLFALACVSILSFPSTSTAITLHVHTTVERVIGHEADGPLTTPKETVRVVRLKPPDSDDDGYADAVDDCPKVSASGNNGCPPPDPAPVESVQTSSYTGGSYTIPSYIVMCESGGDYTAVNPDSGAGGAYQFLPSTWQALGYSGLPQDAPPAVQDEAAARYYAMAGSSPWSCG